MSAGRSTRLEEAVAFSVEHVHGGGMPFTALVADATGRVLGRGVNCVKDTTIRPRMWRWKRSAMRAVRRELPISMEQRFSPPENLARCVTRARCTRASHGYSLLLIDTRRQRMDLTIGALTRCSQMILGRGGFPSYGSLPCRKACVHFSIFAPFGVRVRKAFSSCVDGCMDIHVEAILPLLKRSLRQSCPRKAMHGSN